MDTVPLKGLCTVYEAWQVYLYTYVAMFETIVLNRDVLSLAIVHQTDVYSEDPVYISSDYCKAAYPQWVEATAKLY